MWKRKRSCLVVSDSLWPCGLQPTRLLCPWNSPGKNTGVGSQSLLQGIIPTQGSNLGLPYCGPIFFLSSKPPGNCHLSYTHSSINKTLYLKFMIIGHPVFYLVTPHLRLRHPRSFYLKHSSSQSAHASHSSLLHTMLQLLLRSLPWSAYLASLPPYSAFPWHTHHM